MSSNNATSNTEQNEVVKSFTLPTEEDDNEMNTQTAQEEQGSEMDTETDDGFEFETDLTDWRAAERRSGGSNLSSDRLLIKSKYEKCPKGAIFRVPVAKLTGDAAKDAEIGAAYRISINNMLKAQGHDGRAVRLSADGKQLLIGKDMPKVKN